MKTLMATIWALMCILASGASEAQQIPFSSIPRGIPLGNPMFSKPKPKPKPVIHPRPSIMTVISFNDRTVKICGRDALTGKVDTSNCKTSRLPPVVGKVRKNIEITSITNKFHAWLALEDQKASMCALELSKRKVHCVPIQAPVPQGVDIEYREISDDTSFMLFKPKPGMRSLDPQGKAPARFMGAMRKATQLLQRNMSSAKPIFLANSTTNCYAEELANGWCLPEDDPDYNPGAEPDPYGNERGYEPPPYDPGFDTSPLDMDGCVVTPAGLICTNTGKRPPPPDFGDPMDLPEGPTPWFPQSWCDFAGVFCTGGQVPADNNRGTNSENSGKTMEELYTKCNENYETDYEVCNTNRQMGADYRTFKACTERAANRLAACQQTARDLTNNGAHRAP